MSLPDFSSRSPFGTIAGWKYEKREAIYKNQYKLVPSTADACIDMTGSDVTKALQLTRGHRLVKVILYNMDSSYVDSSTPLDLVKFHVAQGKINGTQYMSRLLYKREITLNESLTVLFGEKYEFDDAEYTLTLNAANTNKVAVEVFVQI